MVSHGKGCEEKPVPAPNLLQDTAEDIRQAGGMSVITYLGKGQKKKSLHINYKTEVRKKKSHKQGQWQMKERCSRAGAEIPQQPAQKTMLK